ncbi:MAG: hypothetical protein BGN87_06250 [Rhizobiales bacterium 65-79]|jgi:hypothetical protein|nr:hypothetical protein [Hyphomicrobiales bacterium]OJU02792.1 MAG: hypothetical protein BGN87_06250 [Rhizobiales bacterium 65-79]
MTYPSSDNGELPRPTGTPAHTAYARLMARCARLDFDDMTPIDYAEFVEDLPTDEFMALIAMHDEYRNREGDAEPLETAWLVERGDSPVSMPLYFTLAVDPLGVWTADSEEALRFAREIDAAGFARTLPVGSRVCEHAWG